MLTHPKLRELFNRTNGSAPCFEQCPTRVKKKASVKNKRQVWWEKVFQDADTARTQLKQDYAEFKSLHKISVKYRVSRMTIQVSMEALNIKRQSRGGANNVKDAKKYRFRGEKSTLTQIHRNHCKNGIKISTFKSRVRNGWDIERALTLPKKSYEPCYRYEKKLYTLSELAEKSCVNKSSLTQRLRRGWDIHEAVNLPLRTRRF